MITTIFDETNGQLYKITYLRGNAVVTGVVIAKPKPNTYIYDNLIILEKIV